MPTKVEKDTVTGTDTTGHEWDGIKELNTPLPKWWLYVFYACILWAIVYYILYPSWPGFSGYLHGVLGYSQRVEFSQKLAVAQQAKAKYLDRIKAMTPAEILKNRELLAFAQAGGKAAFADNCAPCHGPGGEGRPGFPVLADDAWLWGGTIGNIYKTIRFGVRSGSDEGRQGVMPNFGTDGMLKPAQIADVAEFVLSLSGRSTDKAAAERGKAIFAENCAACHGEAGKGNQELGAPNLTDGIWLYGGTKQDIIAQVTHPKMGVMPVWSQRLDPVTIKMLAVYVHSLGGGK
jgi:cytochrome c oxidase cbb3-type subunit 3